MAGKPGRSGRPRIFPRVGPDAEGRPVFIRTPARLRAALELWADEGRMGLSTLCRNLFARAVEAEIASREARAAEQARLEAAREAEGALQREAARVRRIREEAADQERRRLGLPIGPGGNLFVRENVVTVQLKPRERR